MVSTTTQGKPSLSLVKLDRVLHVYRLLGAWIHPLSRAAAVGAYSFFFVSDPSYIAGLNDHLGSKPKCV